MESRRDLASGVTGVSTAPPLRGRGVLLGPKGGRPPASVSLDSASESRSSSPQTHTTGWGFGLEGAGGWGAAFSKAPAAAAAARHGLSVRPGRGSETSQLRSRRKRGSCAPHPPRGPHCRLPAQVRASPSCPSTRLHQTRRESPSHPARRQHTVPLIRSGLCSVQTLPTCIPFGQNVSHTAGAQWLPPPFTG